MPPAANMTAMPERHIGPLNTGRVLRGVAILLLPIALFASKGVAPLFVIAAVLVFILGFDSARIRTILRQPVALGLAAFLGLAAISAIWSIEPVSSLRTALILAATFFGGLFLADTVNVLAEEERKKLYLSIVVGGVLALLLIVFEQLTDGLLNRTIQIAKGNNISTAKNMLAGLNAGMSVFAIFAWAWVLAVKNRFGTTASVLALLMSIGVIFLSSADTPALAFMGGLLVAALSLVSRKIVLALAAVLTVVGITLAPLLPGALPDPHTEARAYSSLSNSGVHRLAIWQTVAEHIAKDPVLGIGMNGTRFLYGNADRVVNVFAADDPAKMWKNLAEPIPLHAHNGILQIWLELGGIGALLLAGVLLTVMWRIRQGFDDVVATALRLGMLFSGMILFSLSFGPWQGWWQAAIWLSIMMMPAAGTASKEEG